MMEIVSIDRSSLLKLSLFSGARVSLPGVVRAVRDKFDFAIAPETLGDAESGVEFSHGSHGGIGIEKLGIYNDGIVIQSRADTSDLDKLYLYILQWVAEEFGIKSVKTHQFDTLYESNLTVKSEKDIVAISSIMRKIGVSLSAALKANSGIEAKCVGAGFTIAPDINRMAGIKPAPFRVERKAGADFAANLFYSSAPLTTEQHRKLLQDLEVAI